MRASASASALALALAPVLGFAPVLGCAAPTDELDVDVALVVTPTALDFGAVTTEAVATRDVVVTHPEGRAFDLTTTLEGSDYAVQLDRAQQAQGRVRLTVTFAPRAAGESSGVLRVRSAQRPEVVVPLRGAGLARELSVTPGRLDFGAVPVGGSSTERVVVTNTSDQAIELHVVRERDVDDCRLPRAAPFCVASTTRPLAPTGETVRIGAREALTFEVTFTARAGASAPTGVLGFARCVDCPPVRVALAAEVLPPGALSCSPLELDVGAVDLGLCSSGVIYCANDSAERRQVLTARLDAGSSAAFGPPSTPLPAVALPRGAVALDVAYCPTTFGADVGTLEIETDDPDPRLRLQRVALRGRGGVARLRAEPSPLEYGEVAVDAPARRRVWLVNDGPTAVTIVQALGRSDTADVDVSPPALQVAPGQRVGVWVTLTARAAGRVAGQLDLVSNDASGNRVVALGADAVELPPCAARVEPTELDFGDVEAGRSLRHALEVENVGAADCLITSVDLESAEGPWRLIEPLSTSHRLPPGRVMTVPIDVWPLSVQSLAGRVTVGVSSSVAPLIERPLRAHGAEGLPLLSPRELDLGAAPLGCATVERTATLYNDGPSPLTVATLALEPPDRGLFTVSTSAPLPATLPPGGTLSITGAFRPTGPSAQATAIRLVATRGPRAYALVLPLAAHVDATGVSVERATQRERPMLDILYVMDNSCGMGGVNQVVSNTVETLLAEATTAQADYRLGVVTMDLDMPQAGQLEPVMGPSAQILTPVLAAPAEALRGLIAGANTEEGSAAEQGLGAFVRALSAPLTLGWNLGLLRPEADLAVLIVSDEDDGSPGTTDYYLDALRAVKGWRTPHRVQLSAVVGDAGGGCTGPIGFAAAGTRYLELARRSGGSSHSICTADWARTLSELGLATFGPKSSFALSGVPQPETLRVTVDGASVASTAWSYDAQVRALTFAPTAVPPAGAQLEVSYQAVCR